MTDMDIGTLLKQTTAEKKKGGWKAGIEFLIPYYSKIKEDDKGQYFTKLFTYFSYDPENLLMRNFVQELINTGTNKYDGIFSQYYFIIKDFEAFHFTINYRINKVNPNKPWQYCYDLSVLYNELCEYHVAIGLEKEDNAIEYIYNFINSNIYIVASELQGFGRNFFFYYSNRIFNNTYKFFHPDRLIPFSLQFAGDYKENNHLKECHKTLNIQSTEYEVNKIISELLFEKLPKQSGININVLQNVNGNLEEFCLTYYQKKILESADIFLINNMGDVFAKNVSNTSAKIASDQANEILKNILPLKFLNVKDQSK